MNDAAEARTANTAPTLLVVDDEAAMRRAILRALDDEPYQILTADSAEAGLDVLRDRVVHVVVSDHNMPGMCGLDFLRTVRLRYPKVARLMVTANDEFDTVVRAINLGEVTRFLRKPWDDDELRCSVRLAFDQVALEREVRKLREQARRNLNRLRDLELKHPGILDVRRDERGAILIDTDLDQDERLRCEVLWND